MLDPVVDTLVQSMNLAGSYTAWVPVASSAVTLSKFKLSVTALDM